MSGSGDPVIDGGAIIAADVAAAAAVARIGADVVSQRSALLALQALGATLPKDGVLRGMWAAYLAERQAALVAFHERRIAAAVDDDARAAAYDDAIAFAAAIGAPDDELARLRSAKTNPTATAFSTSEHDAAPRPFFARFLERQDR